MSATAIARYYGLKAAKAKNGGDNKQLSIISREVHEIMQDLPSDEKIAFKMALNLTYTLNLTSEPVAA